MKQEIREVETGNKSYAACDTEKCSNGAEFELWTEEKIGPLHGCMLRRDSRCWDCAAKQGWIDAETGESR